MKQRFESKPEKWPQLHHPGSVCAFVCVFPSSLKHKTIRHGVSRVFPDPSTLRLTPRTAELTHTAKCICLDDSLFFCLSPLLIQYFPLTLSPLRFNFDNLLNHVQGSHFICLPSVCVLWRCCLTASRNVISSLVCCMFEGKTQKD